MSEQAPFIPPAPDRDAIPPAPWRVFRVPGFLPLFGAQFASSLGDWTGLIAILAIASRVSNSATAVGFVMVARMLPGFLFAPLGGALIDRWNRKVVMVTCDIGRAGLLAVLPFWENIWGLVILSFVIEMLTLLWGPAKDASVPNIVTDPEQLASANSLGLVAAFGTFPLGAVMFAALAVDRALARGFRSAQLVRASGRSRSRSGSTAARSCCRRCLISRLRLPETERGTRRNVPAAQTWRDIKDGLGFIRANPLVRGVMIGLAGGLIGGGAIVPLGATVAQEVLRRGCGRVRVADDRPRRRRRDRRRHAAVAATAAAAPGRVHDRDRRDRWLDHRVASMSSLRPGVRLVVALRARAPGCAYVTGFTMLQESVSDDMRGRTFATLYTIVRVCLLLVAHDRAVRRRRAQRDLAAHGERARPRRAAAHRRCPASGSRCGSAARSPCCRASPRGGECETAAERSTSCAEHPPARTRHVESA